jgi:hypothetical protein
VQIQEFFQDASPACDEAVPLTLTLDVDLKGKGDTQAFNNHVIEDVATADKKQTNTSK